MPTHPEQRKIARKLIGDFLSDIIKERNLKIEPLARECQMEKVIIYNILQGKGYTIDSLLALLQVLRMHIDIKEIDINDKYDIHDN